MTPPQGAFFFSDETTGGARHARFLGGIDGAGARM